MFPSEGNWMLIDFLFLLSPLGLLEWWFVKSTSFAAGEVAGEALDDLPEFAVFGFKAHVVDSEGLIFFDELIKILSFFIP